MHRYSFFVKRELFPDIVFEWTKYDGWDYDEDAIDAYNQARGYGG